MKQSWPTQHFRLLWRPSNSPYQAAMGRPLEGFQKVLEKIPIRHSHPATRLPMNPIRMLLMNIIIFIIIFIIIIIIILPLHGRLDPCQVHDPASNLPCTAGRLDPS